MRNFTNTYLKVLALSFAVALLLTTAALPYYNAITGNSIVMSEEETENGCNSRTILEELHPTFDINLKSKNDAFILLSINGFSANKYKTVYLTVLSPPPDFIQ